MLLYLVFVLIFQPDRTFGSEIMAARHFGKIDEVAGVQPFNLIGALQVDINGFLDTITVAGGADIGAGTAGQTPVTPFLPDIGLKFHVQYLGKIGGVHMGAEPFVLLCNQMHILLVVFFGRLPGFDGF